MSQEIEIEFKNLLTKDEYAQLLQYFNVSANDFIEQTNDYFETKQFDLKTNHAALRIRQKEDNYQLTLKEPNPDGAGLLETHCTLTDHEADQWKQGHIIPKPNIDTRLKHLGIASHQLTYGGALMTKRVEMAYHDTIIVLDKSQYNGNEDYELELEARDETYGQRIFTKLLDDFAIPKRKTPNKIERFYQSM
ncbi:CYTH domain-containing protein [Gracilibacillus halophilus YIM-C55.5]|uniref:CYTH domain-containing protein n=1 Tax=Gracilibacillus halophilus YIM-C55.5 TaxID=1308866 RepID=N4WJ61_9BACI|nr:CYTH domain-containing protein [Gracilibacillus halophilus]ENH96187.1 CYTH domain-containing protein [Gracilibacillus halophilus YIM-C55.5]